MIKHDKHIANIPDVIIEKIKLFTKELENSNLKIEQVLLFGSYASGKNDKWSDIDLAIISDDFTGIKHLDYSRFIDAILKVDKAIEPIPFRTIDFTDDDPLVSEIKQNCIAIN